MTTTPSDTEITNPDAPATTESIDDLFHSPMIGATTVTPLVNEKIQQHLAGAAQQSMEHNKISEQLDVLRQRINSFLDDYSGKKIEEKKSIKRVPVDVPVPPSLANGYGLFHYFGAPRSTQQSKLVEVIEKIPLPRRKNDGITELLNIVDEYRKTINEYATHIDTLCKDHLEPAFHEVRKEKESYYIELTVAKTRAKQFCKESGQLEEKINQYQKKLAATEYLSKDWANLQMGLENLDLKRMRAMHLSTVSAREVVIKKNHIKLLASVEMGITAITLKAHSSAANVRELGRQLQHSQQLSRLSCETIEQLHKLHDKVNDGRPYLNQSNELMMNLLGMTFGRYEMVDAGNASPASVEQSITTYRAKALEQFRLVEKQLEQPPYTASPAKQSSGGVMMTSPSNVAGDVV